MKYGWVFNLTRFYSWIVALLLTVSCATSGFSAEGDLLWQFDKSGNGSAIGSDGTVYTCTYHRLYALNSDGTEKWHYEVEYRLGSALTIGLDGTIYLGETALTIPDQQNCRLYAINPDGTVKWTFPTNGDIESSPAVGLDGTIYVAPKSNIGENYLYALNPDGSQKWVFNIGDYVQTSPAVSLEGTIYIGARESLYAINPDGTQKWIFPTGDYINSSPSIGSDGTIYFGSNGNRIYAVTSEGVEKWSFETENWIFSSPAIDVDGTIYVGSDDNYFYAINPDGTEKWSISDGGDVRSSPAIGDDGTIYVGLNDRYGRGNYYAIDPTGEIKWSYPALGTIYSSPIIMSDGTLYVEISGGKLCALETASTGPAESAWPMFCHDAQHTGQATFLSAKNIEVSVKTNSGLPFDGIRIYAFTSSGSYTGYYSTTDEEGKAQFDITNFEDGAYRFRVDYLQQFYWSDDIEIPEEHLVSVVIQVADLPVYVTAGTDPINGVRVYLFSDSGAYLGIYNVTDEYGEAGFNLPVGMNVKFRVDYLGYQFWNDVVQVLENDQVVFSIQHENIALTVKGAYQGVFDPLAGLNVYLFKPSGSYLSRKEVTDVNGQVAFYLPEQPYRARADYLGQQFWSDDFTADDTSIIIPMAEAQVAVTSDGAPVEDIRVYVFSSTGSYLGIYGNTSLDGTTSFRLPSGGYKFRADYQGNQYWSEVATIVADKVNPVSISTGGGAFTFHVGINQTDPLENVKCYLFNETGTYLGLNGMSGENGDVVFNLADGRYKFRVDYKGYQYWSDMFEVSDVLFGSLLIPHSQVEISVQSEFQDAFEPVPNIPVYLFKPSGAYMGVREFTDENGQVVFYLPEQEYTFRADYLGMQYFSEVLNGENGVIAISMADAEITVTSGTGPLVDTKVYVFSGAGSYLGINNTTDADGRVVFRLPAGDYTFRADYQGNQYFSGVSTLSADQVSAIDISTGGGVFTYTVSKGVDISIEGVRCYVFNSQGTYLGVYETTDHQGQVSFNLSEGSFKIRADYLGYQFWSDVYDVPDMLYDVMAIPHQDVIITAVSDSQDQQPVSGLNVYLFSPSGSYLGQSGVTDALGQVTFYLPDQEYKVRVDSSGNSYWSEIFQSQDTVVAVD